MVWPGACLKRAHGPLLAQVVSHTWRSAHSGYRSGPITARPAIRGRLDQTQHQRSPRGKHRRILPASLQSRKCLAAISHRDGLAREDCPDICAPRHRPAVVQWPCANAPQGSDAEYQLRANEAHAPVPARGPFPIGGPPRVKGPPSVCACSRKGWHQAEGVHQRELHDQGPEPDPSQLLRRPGLKPAQSERNSHIDGATHNSALEHDAFSYSNRPNRIHRLFRRSSGIRTEDR